MKEKVIIEKQLISETTQVYLLHTPADSMSLTI